MKVANVKSVKKCSPGVQGYARGTYTLPSAHKNTLCVPSYCADQVRGGDA